MKYARIGSISHGTMRLEDLIPDFLSELADLALANKNKEHLKRVKEIEKDLKKDKYFSTENADFDLDDLFDMLNEYAPPYFYFGGHSGDGSDYGFWLIDNLNQEIKDSGGLVVEDTGDIPKKFEGEVLQINDHGNATLYYAKNGKLKEIWGVV